MRTARIHLLALVLALGLTLLSGQPVFGQSKTLVWERYDVRLVVEPNGDLQVLERQTIRFVSGTFSFGFAVIPLDKTDGITNVSVTEPGGMVYEERGYSTEPYTFFTNRNGNDLEIEWHFPPLREETRTFDLAYTVHGALRVYDTGDKLQWIAIDNERDFPIEAASVAVVLPPGARFQLIDSAGVAATWEQGDDGRQVTYRASGPMSPADTFEIGVEFTHGVIPDQKPAWQAEVDRREAYDLNVRPWVNLGVGLISALLLLGGPALVYAIWYTRGRDPKVGPVPEEISEPPDGLPPGVLGTLIDEQADMKDVVATIVDLARRGYMRIEESEERSWLGLGARDFIFRRGEASIDRLRPYERTIVDGILPRGSNERSLKDLQNKFYTRLPEIQRKLYEEMISQGFFRSRPDKVRGLWRGLGLAVIIGGIALGFFTAAPLMQLASLSPCLFVALAVTGGALLLAGGHMPAKTRKGAEAAAKWKAFKKYLTDIDKFTDVAQAGELFDRYLPYAIAFGLKDSWIFKFSAQPATPIPGWYIPYGPWLHPTRRGGPIPASVGGRGGAGEGLGGLQGMSDGLAGGLQSMSDGLTRLLNSTGRVLQSAPSSSGRSGGGGFGSGGFSGGGGGGGGARGFG